MRIGDTSALYAAFVKEDAHHAAARSALEDPDPIPIPSEILAETIALLQLRLGFERARSAGIGLRATPHVRMEGPSKAVVTAAWAIFEAAGGKLSLPDAFVVAWCRNKDAPAITFDREIKRALTKLR